MLTCFEFEIRFDSKCLSTSDIVRVCIYVCMYVYKRVHMYMHAHAHLLFDYWHALLFKFASIWFLGLLHSGTAFTGKTSLIEWLSTQLVDLTRRLCGSVQLCVRVVSVLQWVAVSCSVLQCVEVAVLQRVAVCCSVLQRAAVWCKNAQLCVFVCACLRVCDCVYVCVCMAQGSTRRPRGSL